MIYDELFPYQKSIVDTYKYKKAFGLFLDMGLGKTPLSLAFAEQNNCTKLLIITLNNKALESEDLNGSWLWWAKKSKYNYVFHNKKDDVEYKDNDLLIINYESLYERKAEKKINKVTIKEAIQKFIVSCDKKNVAIIIDESHKLKDTQSMQTQAVLKIKKSIELVSNNSYLYLLTGTPFTTGYIDLYSQLKLLGYGGNKTNFCDNYCIRANYPNLLGWQQPIIGYKNLDSLYDMVHKYAITIKSKEVINLPEQIFIDHITPESEEFRLLTRETYQSSKIYRELKSRDLNQVFEANKHDIKINNPFYRNINYPDQKWLAETSGNFWLRSREISIGFQGNEEDNKWFNKTRLLQLEQFLFDNPDNYVLFYNFTPELFEIFNICEKLKYKIDVYCGDIKTEYYYQKYSNQNESERLTNTKNIILANFQSGSTGKNWQLYNKCIIFSIPLFGNWEQGIKRVHRVGQKNAVFYHLFYQNNWLDKSMIEALKQNIEYSEDLFETNLKLFN